MSDQSSLQETTPIPPSAPPEQQENTSKQSCFLTFIEKNHTIIYSFVVMVMIILFGSYLHTANNNLKESQKKIISVFEFTQKQTETNIKSFIEESKVHRVSLNSCVDKQLNLIAGINIGAKDSLSLSIAGLFVKLEADIIELHNQNEAISRVAADSLSRKYEAMMNYQVSEKLLDLHLAKIEHEYSNITTWAAILTVIFLIFSFYSLFKIEQSRNEIEMLADKGEWSYQNVETRIRQLSIDNSSQLHNYQNILNELERDYRDKLDELNLRLTQISSEQTAAVEEVQTNQ